jgi:hypothetical protein
MQTINDTIRLLRRQADLEAAMRKPLTAVTAHEVEAWANPSA